MKPEEKEDIKSLGELKFDDKGLIPAIVQDYRTREVLMVAYMNEESLKKTLELKKTCFWSRSRQQYWVKGETSGHFQFVKVSPMIAIKTRFDQSAPGRPGLSHQQEELFL